MENNWSAWVNNDVTLGYFRAVNVKIVVLQIQFFLSDYLVSLSSLDTGLFLVSQQKCAKFSRGKKVVHSRKKKFTLCRKSCSEE